jgi:GT2 family glycosyltransferase
MVSIIIPTYNGGGKILNILKALENQTYKDFEVIVVIDGSTDGTKQIIGNANLELKSLKVLEQENKGRAAVRNRGACEASGNLMIFFDDDMRPDFKCVELHVLHHQKFEGSIMVGRQIEDYNIRLTDLQLYKASLSRQWEDSLKIEYGPLQQENPYLTAANFSIQRKEFEKLFGFDIRLTDAEDFDLAVRASKLGIQIYYNKEAIGWHDDFITCRSYIKRRRQYNIAQKKLRYLKEDVYKNIDNYLFDAENNKLKKFIYWCFSWPIWVKVVDDTNLLKILPTRFRYKLYNMIIISLSSYYPMVKL